MVGLILIALVEPHILCFGLKQGLMLRARLRGSRLTLGKVEGSVFEPITFRNINFESLRQGVHTVLSVERAEARFSWKALLVQRGNGFFDQLILDGLRGAVTFETDRSVEAAQSEPAKKHSPSTRPFLPAPARVEVRHGNFALRLGNRSVDFEEAHFAVSATEASEIAVEKLRVESNRGRKTFTGLRGVTAIQNTRLVIADLAVDEGIRLKSLSTDLFEASRGRLQIDFDVAAFGGSIRGELLNAAHKRLRNYEITGSFSNISVAALAAFLDVKEKTGGTIKEGKFTFRGSPQELDKATVSTRLEATDFVWGKRQWNSLTLGATFVNRHVQVPELQLQQAHNELKLKGEVTVPEEEGPLWLSDFNFDVAGRINNLTELSALFGPHFANTAGVMTIDGSIRGEKKVFSGQLLVHGSKITYRGAPIDLLNAGIKLDGNEFQVVNLELVHGADSVRGKGVINILGERRYSGEVQASIGDLADYAPLLEKPIAPAPLAGGVVFQWAGDGSASAHSGAFTAKLRKFRSLGSPEIPATLPIDADLEGTYAPGGLFLSKCFLANADTRLETRVTADVSTLKLEALKLTQKNVLWLEGDAVLPLNLWRWWTEPGLSAITPDAPFNVQLNAKGVQLEEVAHLTGRPIPVTGLLTGSLRTEGTLQQPRMTGAVKLTKGRLPANEWLPALEGLEADAEVDGHLLRISKFSARNEVGQFTATGAIDLAKFDAPAFDLLVHGEKVRFSAGESWSGTANLDIAITGSREASVTGGAELLSLDKCPLPDFGALISTASIESILVPAPHLTLPVPMDRWNYNLAVTTPEPVKLKDGEASLDLRLSGTGAALTATGSVTYTNLSMGTAFAFGKVEKATFFLGAEPAVVAHLVGRIDTAETFPGFDGYYFGPINKLSYSFGGERLEDAANIQDAFSPGVKPLDPEAGEIHIDLGPLVYNEALAPQEPPAPAEPVVTTVSGTTEVPANTPVTPVTPVQQ